MFWKGFQPVLLVFWFSFMFLASEMRLTYNDVTHSRERSGNIVVVVEANNKTKQGQLI